MAELHQKRTLAHLSFPAGPGKQAVAGPGKQQLAGRGRGYWRTFDATDGLLGGTIRAILQDAEGALWVGSYGGGLSRYDGQRFRTFTAKDGLPSHLVQSVVLAQDGALWIGTYGQGIYRYDGQGFENFTTADGLVSDLVLRVFQDREGNIWAGTWNGLSRYDGRRFASFTTEDGLPAGEVHAIFQDREGYLWFGTGAIAGGSAGGVCRYDGHRFTPFTAAEGLPAKNGVWAILQDQEGSLWFGTAGGVSRYDGKEFTTFTTQDGLGADNVWAMLQDQQGALWFGTKYGGVSRYDGKGFTTFTAQDGLGANSLEAILQDREGLFWFGTWNGLSRYDANTFTTFTTQDGLADDQVYSICQDRKGALWFGTAGGLCRYDGHTFTTFTTEDGLPDNRVSCIFQDREGMLWLSSATQSSGRGICRYDGCTFTAFTTEDGLADDRVFSVCQDREGVLWFATGNGMKVSRYDGRVFTTFTMADDLPLTAEITAIAQDREGRFWFATHGGGICRYDGHNFTTFTTRDGLAHDIVRSMLQDREGVLWFGTVAGVCRYDGHAFTTPEGLAGDNLGGEEPRQNMVQDWRGVLWIGIRSGGVCCYDGQVFQSLTQQDGLPSNASTPALEDREGNLWFATNRGVTRYHPPPPSSPPLFLDAVVADRRYEGVSEVEVLDSMKVTAFEFHSISFRTRPEAMIYRYRLAGYEDEWKNTHGQRVEYQNLPLGEYTFQLQAVDQSLNYSGLVEVRLKIVPDPRDQQIDELEQRVQERTRELEEKNRVLAEATQAKSSFLASMSHELRTPMNAIVGFAQLLRKNTEANLSALELSNVEVIRRNAGELLVLIEQLLDLSRIEAGRMQVLVESFTVEGVVGESLSVVEPLVGDKPVRLQIEYEGDGKMLRTDRSKVKQILVNLLSNGVKFTETGVVGVRARVGEDQVCFEVWDTGVGIAEEELVGIFEEFRQVRHPGMGQGTGLGLAITRRLCRLLGGEVEVESQVAEVRPSPSSCPGYSKPHSPAHERDFRWVTRRNPIRFKTRLLLSRRPMWRLAATGTPRWGSPGRRPRACAGVRRPSRKPPGRGRPSRRRLLLTSRATKVSPERRTKSTS